MSVDANDIAICESCSCQMDIGVLAPFTNIECPQCGTQVRVKVELDKYILLRRQGVGGMSLVFAAKDKSLGREVAIKILNEDYSSDSKRIKQFEQEATITAGISHPNVVRVYTVGKAFNRYYIAMELVNGKPLETIMADEGAIPEETIIPKMLQVTEGLNAAYKVGLIHRDMKPGNILIDNLDMAKIVDFGLALVTQGGVVTATEIWATPYYVPPEALNGQPEDFRSDVYALSATMYHALAGKAPFEEKTKHTRELAEIKQKIPKLKEVAPWLSDSTCAVIDKGMEYEPDNRFKSYEEMILALQFAEDNIGVDGASLPSNESSKQGGSGTNKLLIPLILGVLVVGVGGFFIVNSIIGSQRERVAPVVDSSLNTGDSAILVIDEELRAEVEDGYRDLYEKIESKKYTGASERALSLLKVEKHPEPSRSLSGLHGVIAEYLNGQPNEARKLVAVVKDHIQKANFKRRVNYKRDFTKALDYMVSLDSTDADHRSFQLDLTTRGMFLFLKGLKFAESGEWKKANTSLTRFGEMDFSDSGKHEKLFLLYQSISEDYLSDIKSLEKLTSAKLVTFDIQQLEEYAESIERLALATDMQRGPWLEKYLLDRCSRQIVKLKDEESDAKSNEAAQATPPQNITTLTYSELVSELSFLLEERSYRQIEEKVESATMSSEADELKREKFLYFCVHAAQYVEAFAVTLPGKEITDKVKNLEGDEILVESVEQAGFKITVEGESQLLEWNKTDAQSLLKMYLLLVEEEDDEQKNKMLENAACFAHMNELPNLAEAASSKLSSIDSDFSERWESAIAAFEN